MKKVTKLFLLVAFALVSVSVSAQSFTIAELVDLASNGKHHFERKVSDKGYTLQEVDAGSGDLAINTTFALFGNSKITFINPTFPTDVKMVTWNFNTPAILKQLEKELRNSNYALTNTERRNAGKYVSLYYSRPGIDFILTTDKTVDPNGVYIASVKFTNAADFIVR